MVKKNAVENLDVSGMSIRVFTEDFESDFVSLTDIAKYRSEEPAAVVANWLRSRDTLEYLGLWESMNNPEFNLLEFEEVKLHSGTNAFTLSPSRWIQRTGAIRHHQQIWQIRWWHVRSH